MEEHNHFVDTITGLFLTALGSLPAMMGGNDLTIRRKWEAFAYYLRRKLADEALLWQKRQSEMTDAELANDRWRQTATSYQVPPWHRQCR
jgi:hypothetical protein